MPIFKLSAPKTMRL